MARVSKTELTATVSQDAVITPVTDDALATVVDATVVENNFADKMKVIGVAVEGACVKMEDAKRGEGSATQRMAAAMFDFHAAMRGHDVKSVDLIEAMDAAAFKTAAIKAFLGARPAADAKATGAEHNARETYDNRAQLVRRGVDLMIELHKVGVGRDAYSARVGFFLLPRDLFLPHGHVHCQFTPERMALDAKWYRIFKNEVGSKQRASIDTVKWAVASQKAGEAPTEKVSGNRAPRINVPTVSENVTGDDGAPESRVVAAAAVLPAGGETMLAATTPAQVQAVIAQVKTLPPIDAVRAARDVMRDYVEAVSKDETVGANADLLNMCADLADYANKLRALIKAKQPKAA